MVRIESSIRVARSIEEVFTFLDTVENHARFIPNMIEFNKTSPGPFGRVGATVLGLLRILGQRIQVPYEIIEHEHNHKFAMKGLMGPVAFRDGYILTPTADGAQIKFWLELTVTGLARLIGPFVALIGKVHSYETLHNLKRELEMPPSRA